jgi:hypothetical protein
MEEQKNITVKIPKDLHKAYRARLVEDETTHIAKITQWITDYINSPQTKQD